MPLFSRKPVPEVDPHLQRMRDDTARGQAKASDPAASAWVSANAGTGKTHVLANRVLRLLLAGTKPERILALTYTKAAAAEMSKRVFERLAEWVVDDEADLAKKLAALTGSEPGAEAMRHARRLFAIAIETPGGLKVQTIHAFCERLLQRFSLEAGVPPGFAILDDQERAHLLRQAIDATLRQATAQDAQESGLARAVRLAVRFAAEQSFEELLREALGKRDWLAHAAGADLAQAEAACRAALGLEPGIGLDDVDARMAAVITPAELERARAVLASSGKSSDQDAARRIARALRATGPLERTPALCDIFLNKDREPRKALFTKALAAEHAVLVARLERAREDFAALVGLRARAQVLDASLALLRIAHAVTDHYAEAKAQRAALDFEDLVAKAASLLDSSGAVEWVLFKLDGGLDHILVDEAQDTAPLQWQVVRALAQEFFSGQGAHAGVRTLFAVGDEKQSIYGFQGAAPGMFRKMGDEFGFRAEAASHVLHRIELALSFRSVAPLLETVDRVFADSLRTPGVGGGTVRHLAHRTGHAGLVELWPMELPADKAHSAPWDPLQPPMAAQPSARLAARIADTIAGWLRSGEKLASANRPVRAGDIIVLVRKRAPFAPVMVSALKARGIPVAGADRLVLTEQIAVMDLMALGQVLVLPDDDLALACVLKSPLFGLDDDDLLALAPGRAGTLWQRLRDRAPAQARYGAVLETLQRWRRSAREMAPYEFYAALLDGEGHRAGMLGRLGPDAADPIDEFLNLALAYGEHAPPTLQGFLSALREGRHEIKRDMEQGRDEVRVMTVHGAKGLEAPIVFLPDTCHVVGGRQGTLLQLPGAPFVWPVKGTSRVEAVDTARQAAARSETEERNRLLYVALTRARDRLYVAGFQNSDRPPADDCWHHLVRQALSATAREIPMPDGRPILRLESRQTEASSAPTHVARPASPRSPLPAWASRPAPVEPLLSVPLAPSRLAPLEMEAGDATRPDKPAPRRRPLEPVILPPAILADEARFLRGTLTHALLEHLPTLPAGKQEEAAHAFLAAQAAKLTQAGRASIVAETLAILRDPRFAPLFGPDSRAEVALAAEIPRPRGGKGPALRLAGKIDRLVQQGNSVLIVDYKTNRPPPDDPSRVADAYLLQLAAYRLAVQSIFPRCSIRSAILWTDGPRIMEIAAHVLDDYQQRLWELDPANLDA